MSAGRRNQRVRDTRRCGECNTEGMQIRFSLAHSAPIMSSLLGKQLRYLKDEELARSIITGTYDIPTNLDEATTLILKEIGKMGLKILNGEGQEIIITPAEFTQFWKKVG